MKNILLAVDDTKGSKAAIPAFSSLFPCVRPENVILLYVERFEGRSLMTEMLPESELATLKEVLQGTEYKAALDKKADAILGYYRKALEEKGGTGIKADMIIIGSRGKTVGNLFMGSVSREVANKAEIPVLLVK